MSRYLSGAEFEVVRERATILEGETNCDGRMAAGVMLGLHGLRCADVCGLRLTDLDAGRGALHVDTLKHDVPREVDLKPRIATWLAKLAHGEPASSPPLRTCRGRPLHPNQFQRTWQRLSLQWLNRPVRFHCLRHTAAQRFWLATKDMWVVRRFLGHKSLTSTLIYVSSAGELRAFMPDLGESGTFQPLLFDAG